MAAMAIESRVLGMLEDRGGEDLDRLLIAPEISRPPADPDGCIGAAGILLQHCPRVREVLLESGAPFSRHLWREKRLAEQRRGLRVPRLRRRGARREGRKEQREHQ